MNATHAADEGRSSTVRNVMLVLEYDGTRYHGFQAQAGNVPTIQGELERALWQITGLETRIAGAGRTDSGVHASGQVASFRTTASMAGVVLRGALNAVLPVDIAVLSAADMPPEFHARFSARSREYRYTILNRPVRSPFDRLFTYHVPMPLDAAAMAAAGQELIGEKDFASFAGASRHEGSTVRRVLSVSCGAADRVLRVDIVANAFLPHMVRNIVGTLLMVGAGKLDLAGFRTILAARERAKAGPAAPAHGLCLTRVNY